MTQDDTPAADEPPLPVLTDVAVPGDRAREHGIDLGPASPAPAFDGADAEHYLSERIRAAVAENLPEAVRNAARGTGRDDDGDD